MQTLRAQEQFHGKWTTKTVPTLEKRVKGKNCEEDKRMFFDISLGQEWNKLPAIYQDNRGLCGLVRGYLHQIQSRYSTGKKTHTYQTNNQPKMCVSLEVFRKSELNT